MSKDINIQVIGDLDTDKFEQAIQVFNESFIKLFYEKNFSDLEDINDKKGE